MSRAKRATFFENNNVAQKSEDDLITLQLLYINEIHNHLQSGFAIPQTVGLSKITAAFSGTFFC